MEPTATLAMVAPGTADGSGALRRSNRFLVAALLITLLLWNVPYGWYALYPFKLFATWLHESSHGLIMLLAGAGFDRMEIFRDTSGLAFPEHGVSTVAQGVISSAGYMGTAFFGAVFLVLGRTPRGTRVVIFSLAALMAVSAALYVRNGFGVAATLGGAAVLAAIGMWAGEAACGFTVNFLAAQSCINAVLDIRILFGATMVVNGSPHGQSDAHTVARVIGGPYWLWAGLWLFWSFALFYAALRWVRIRSERHPHHPPAAA